jgi:hypothetical protein
VQDGVVASAQIIVPVHRGQQLFNQIPPNGAGRQFATIGSRRVDAVKPARRFATIGAEAQKGPQVSHFMLKRLALNLTACELNEDFDMFGCQRRKIARRYDRRGQKGIDRHQMLPDRCRSQSPHILEILPISQPQSPDRICRLCFFESSFCLQEAAI